MESSKAILARTVRKPRQGLSLLRSSSLDVCIANGADIYISSRGGVSSYWDKRDEWFVHDLAARFRI
jgi:hypothetical protein